MLAQVSCHMPSFALSIPDLTIQHLNKTTPLTVNSAQHPPSSPILSFPTALASLTPPILVGVSPRCILSVTVYVNANQQGRSADYNETQRRKCSPPGAFSDIFRHDRATGLVWTTLMLLELPGTVKEIWGRIAYKSYTQINRRRVFNMHEGGTGFDGVNCIFYHLWKSSEWEWMEYTVRRQNAVIL